MGGKRTPQKGLIETQLASAAYNRQFNGSRDAFHILSMVQVMAGASAVVGNAQ